MTSFPDLWYHMIRSFFIDITSLASVVCCCVFLRGYMNKVILTFGAQVMSEMKTGYERAEKGSDLNWTS